MYMPEESADTEGSSLSPRIKRRIRAKTSLAEIERKERGRTNLPGPPSFKDFGNGCRRSADFRGLTHSSKHPHEWATTCTSIYTSRGCSGKFIF